MVDDYQKQRVLESEVVTKDHAVSHLLVCRSIILVRVTVCYPYLANLVLMETANFPGMGSVVLVRG